MPTPMRCAWLLAAGIAALPLHAQDSPVTIGASLPLSGAQAEAGKEGLSIMQAQVEAFNKLGGLGGKPLTLRVLDDGYEPQRAAGNARQLIQEGAVALLNCWGTASCAAMQPEIQQGQTALVGVIAGAGSMRQQPSRFVYPLRASTQAEIAAMLQQMQTIGLRRVAIVHQNDGFGKDSLQIALTAFAAKDLKPVITLAVEASGANTPELARQLAAQPDLQGVIVLAGAPATIGLISMARRPMSPHRSTTWPLRPIAPWCKGWGRIRAASPSPPWCPVPGRARSRPSGTTSNSSASQACRQPPTWGWKSFSTPAPCSMRCARPRPPISVRA